MNACLRHALAASILVALSALPASVRADDGWDWQLAPYLWAVSIKTDLNEEQPPGEQTTDFSNILDKFDGAFLGHAEGQGDSFGVFADIVYLGLADDRDFDRLSTQADLDSTIVELALVYSPGPERYRGIEAFGGVRYIDLSLDVDVDFDNPAVPDANIGPERSYTDFLIGARYHAALSDRWGLSLRGDGSFGDTEGTWSASGIFHYRMSNGAWVFGYRYLDGELATESEAVDITIYGPVVGYSFAF
jgi:hypothetical protein